MEFLLSMTPPRPSPCMGGSCCVGNFNEVKKLFMTEYKISEKIIGCLIEVYKSLGPD